MYVLVSAQGLPVNKQSNWTTINGATASVKDLYLNYRKIVVTLTATGEPEPIFVDMEQLRSEFSSFSNTLQVLVASLGARPLETIAALPSSRVGYAKYVDAYQAGYKLNFAKAGYAVPANAPVEQTLDLVISRSGISVDLKKIHDYCMMSVNGFFHNTTKDSITSYVLDGGKTCVKTQVNCIGLTSFMEIGKLTKLKITDDMISKSNPIGTLKDGIIIRVPAGFLSKTFFMVLGGYLVYPDAQVLHQISETEFRLNIQHLPYIDRIYESEKYIDLSPLGLDEQVGWETVIQGDEVWSDAVLTKYLKLSQSFVVAVDTDNLFFEKHAIRQARYPGHFYTPDEPMYPLIVATGRIGEYWKRKEDVKYGLYVHDSFVKNRMYYHAPNLNLTAYAAQLSFNRPYYFSQGYLLEIGGYLDQESN